MDTNGNNKRSPRPSQNLGSGNTLSPTHNDVDPNTIAALDKMMTQLNDNEENEKFYNSSFENVGSSTSTVTDRSSAALNKNSKRLSHQRLSIKKDNFDATAVAELSNFKMTTVEDDPFDILLHKQQRASTTTINASLSMPTSHTSLSSSLSAANFPSSTIPIPSTMDSYYPSQDDLGEEIRQRYLSTNKQSSSPSNSSSSSLPSSTNTFSWDGVKIGGRNSNNDNNNNNNNNNNKENDGSALPLSEAHILNHESTIDDISSSRIPSVSKIPTTGKAGGTNNKSSMVSKSGHGVAMQQYSTVSGGGKNLLDQLKLKDAEIDRLEAIILAMSPTENGSGSSTTVLSAQRLLNVGGGKGTKVSSTNSGDDPRDAKIMELAKKNRSLNVALNKEKDRASKLSNELQVYQTHQSSSSSSRNPSTTKEVSSSSSNDMLQDAETFANHNIGTSGTTSNNPNMMIKSLQNALAKAQRTAERATIELKATHRILQKEIGTDAPLNKILAAHGIVNSMVLGDLSSLTTSQTTGYTDNVSLLPISPPMSAGGDTVNSRSNIPPHIVSSNQSVISSSASATGNVLSESGKVNNPFNNTKFTPGEWRGRQQIITLLRTRIKALERELIKYSTNQPAALASSSIHNNFSSVSSVPLSMSSIPEHENHSYETSSSSLTPNKNLFPSRSVQQSTPSVQLLINSETGAPADEAFGLGLDAEDDQSILPGSSSVVSNNPSPQGIVSSSSSSSSSASVSQFPSHTIPHPSGSVNNAPSFDVDDRAAAMLTARDNTKAMQIARLNEQLSGAKTDMERARMEASAAKARNTILETELKKFKNHVKSLLTKTEADDKLIESLRNELKSVKQALLEGQKKLATAQLNTLPGEEKSVLNHSGTSGGRTTSSHGTSNDNKTINALKQQIASLREELELLHSVNNSNNTVNTHAVSNNNPRVPSENSSMVYHHPVAPTMEPVGGMYVNHPPSSSNYYQQPSNGNNGSPVRSLMTKTNPSNNNNTNSGTINSTVMYTNSMTTGTNNSNNLPNTKLPLSKPKYTNSSTGSSTTNAPSNSSIGPHLPHGSNDNHNLYYNTNTTNHNNNVPHQHHSVSSHHPLPLYGNNDHHSTSYDSNNNVDTGIPSGYNPSYAVMDPTVSGNIPFVGSPGFRVVDKQIPMHNYAVSQQQYTSPLNRR